MTPDLVAARRALAATPSGSPWRVVAALRLRLAEAAAAERLRATLRDRRAGVIETIDEGPLDAGPGVAMVNT